MKTKLPLLLLETRLAPRFAKAQSLVALMSPKLYLENLVD